MWTYESKFNREHHHREQTKRCRMWFSTKSCSCYSTKTCVNRVILILELNLTWMKNIHLKWSSMSTTHLLMYMFLIKVKFSLVMSIMVIRHDIIRCSKVYFLIILKKNSAVSLKKYDPLLNANRNRTSEHSAMF